MFFGEDLQVQQYSDMKYPIFDKLNQQQLGYFWRPEEVSLQKDRNDYLQLNEQQKFIFTSNLKYQTMLDSVQGRGSCLAFLPFVSNPELEGCIVTWDFMKQFTVEVIHTLLKIYIQTLVKFLILLLKMKRLKREVNQLQKCMMNLLI